MCEGEQCLNEIRVLLEKVIADLHNSATLLQVHQRLGLAQIILDGAGKLHLALNEIKIITQ